MPTVTNTVTDAAGDPVEGAAVVIRLIATTPESTPAAGFLGVDDETIVSQIELTTDAAGEWSTNLVANDLITPAGTYYLVTERPDVTPRRPAVKYRISVPDGAGPYWAGDILTEAPDSLPSAVSTATAVSFTPTGTIEATNVQAAIAELALESGTTVTPERFGAVGDGVADDSAALALFFATGGLLHLTPGATYKATAILNVLSGTRLEGHGATLDILKDGTSAGRYLNIDSKSNVVIRDVKIACSTAAARNQVYGMVSLFTSTDVVLEDVEVTGGEGCGIFVLGGSNIKMTRCTVHDTWADGIHVSRGVTDVFITDPHVYEVDDDAIAVWSKLADGATNYSQIERVVIENAIVHDMQVLGSGISIIGAKDVAVIGGVFTDINPGAGVKTAADISHVATNVHITGAVATRCYQGFIAGNSETVSFKAIAATECIDSGMAIVASDDVFISGASLTDNTVFGLYVASGANAAISASDCRRNGTAAIQGVVTSTGNVT